MPRSKSVNSAAVNHKLERNGDDNLREIAGRNRLIVKLLYYFISLEIPMNRCSFDSRTVSLTVARIRLFAFIWLAGKFLLLILLEDCEYAEFRYYLGDWTVLYPESRRSAQIRVFLVVSVVHLASKRSVFFRKHFDSSLFDYLVQLPGQTSPTEQSNEEQFNSSSGSFGKVPSMGAIRSSSDLTMIRSRKSTKSMFASKQSINETGITMSDWNEHWRFYSHHSPSIRQSLLRQSYMQKFSINDSRSDCSKRSNIAVNRDSEHWLRVGSTMRRSFRRSCIIYTGLLGIPMMGAVTRMASFKNTSSCSEDPSLIRLLGAIEIAFIMSETILNGIGIQAVLSSVCEDINCQLQAIRRRIVDLISNDDYEEREKLLNEMQSSFSYRSISSPHERLSTGSFDFLDSMAATIESGSCSGGKLRTTDLHLSLTLDSLREAQRRTVSMLDCFENHKRLLTFLGDSAYLWFLTSLSFVPLIVTVRANSSENKVAVIIYYTIVMASGACYFLFAIVSANLNYKVSVESKTGEICLL